MTERARSCEVRRASDGTLARVQGDIDQGSLDVMAAFVRHLIDNMCKAVSDVPMPALAQKIHDRETYWCGRPSGHDGPHQWPAEGDRPPVAEWGAS